MCLFQAESCSAKSMSDLSISSQQLLFMNDVKALAVLSEPLEGAVCHT